LWLELESIILLGHPVAMEACDAAYAMGAAFLGCQIRTWHNRVIRELK
jgi:hypothetical protein